MLNLTNFNKYDLVRLSVLIFFSCAWSMLLFHYWSWDYGLHYNSAVNISDNYLLYKNIFDNKGPFFYFYIYILSKVIGVGAIQAYFTLTLIVTFFFVVTYLIAKYKSDKNLFLIVFLLCSTLFMQNINIPMRLFHTSIIIVSLFYLLEGFKDKNTKYIFFSIILLSLSTFTEIDGIIYAPIYIFILFLMYFQKKISVKNFIILLFSLLIIPLFIFLALANFFSFSLEEFIFHNITFNSKVSSGSRDPFLENFDDPTHIYLIMITGIGVIFINILSNLYNLKINSFSSLTKEKNNIFSLGLIIVFLGIFFWLWTGSAKNYHVFIVFAPLIFFISYFYEYLKINFIEKIFFYLLTIFFTIITLYPDSYRSYKNKCWIIENKCGTLNNLSKTIIDINKLNKEPFIIGSNGWLYLTSGIKPTFPIADHLIYMKERVNGKLIDLPVPNYLLDHYRYIQEQKTGFIYWIDRDLINRLNTKSNKVSSDRVKDILNKSVFIEDQGTYLKYRIK
ncbi:hypothetical protein OA954_02570 [Alphaproteobacteria bacterium]|nr:hypothetical protein [Alphaproteobacteria bacterium]